MSKLPNQDAVNLSIYPPSKMATKQLALQHCSDGRRKIRVSTNWLPLFGFEKGTEVVEELIGEGKGLVVRWAKETDKKTKKVYQRSYPTRRNNPIETQLDIQSQTLLDKAIPADAEFVHVTFTKGRATIVPVTRRQARRIQKAKEAKDLMSAFVACSSGVDMHSLHETGFRIDTLLEYRPNEKRDKKDLTETGALNAIANVPVKNLINEDIGEIDLVRLAKATSSSPSTLFHLSLQCDEFSPLKAKTLKERALCDLSTSADMVFDALRIIETQEFPAILLENVGGFMDSEANAIFETKLRKWGYRVHKSIMHSPEHEGLTNRKRYYMFATSFDAPFEWPEPQPVREEPIWNEHIAPYLDDLRDVTHSKSIQDGAKGIDGGKPRLRVITPESSRSPTFVKSHDRMNKDSVVVQMPDGRFLFPDASMVQRLMRVPESFNLNSVSKTIATEILGQSIDYTMHTRIIESVKRHLELASAGLFGKRQLSLMQA